MLAHFSFLINLSLKAISSDTPGGSNSNILNFFQNNWKQLYAVSENSLIYPQEGFELFCLQG